MKYNNSIGRKLSRREVEVIESIVSGLQNKEIARKMAISLRTVETHNRNIFKKMGVAGRTVAAVQYIVRFSK